METERRQRGKDGDGGSGGDKRRNMVSQTKGLGLSPGTPFVGHVILGEVLNPIVTNGLGMKNLRSSSSFWLTRACAHLTTAGHTPCFLDPAACPLPAPPGCDVTPQWFQFECLLPWAPRFQGTNDHNLKLFLNSSDSLVNGIIR